MYIRALIALVVCAAYGVAQPVMPVNGTVNFSGRLNGGGAVSTAPLLVTGTAPPTCTVGDLYFSTGAAAGSNIQVCAGANVWTPVSSTGAAATTPELKVVRTSATVLTIGAATAAAPSNWAFGGKVNSLATIPTVTLASGSGTVYIYGSVAGNIIAGYTGVSITCATGCTAVPGITGFPDDVFRIASWTAATGTWAATGTDLRAVYNRGPQLLAGSGISLTADESAGNVTIASSAAGPSVDSPQIICVNSNINGTPNTTITYSNLANCIIPAGTLAIGDNVRVIARFGHNGGTTISPRLQAQFGTSITTEQACAATAIGCTLLYDVVVQGAATEKGNGRFIQDGTGTPLSVTGATVLTEAISGAITLNFFGRMTTAGAESVTIDWYTVEVLKSK